MKFSVSWRPPELFVNELGREMCHLPFASSPFQFVAVVLALACVVSAQLADDWSSNRRAEVDSDDLAVRMGRNILFRRTSTRFEKLEQTTETLTKNLQGKINLN